MSVVRIFAEGIGWLVMLLMAWAVVMSIAEMMLGFWREARMECEPEVPKPDAELRRRLMDYVGTVDPVEIRKMLDQAWETREPKAIVPGPDWKVLNALYDKHTDPKANPTAKELAARLGKT